jgi:hypothetical protein
VAPAHILTGSYPYNLGIVGVNGHGADGVGGLIIENRLPGNPAVGRFPQITGAGSYVPGTWIGRIYCNIRNTSAHDGRADAPEPEANNGFGYDCFVFRLSSDISCGKNKSDDQ